jgi:UPF0755 protein
MLKKLIIPIIIIVFLAIAWIAWSVFGPSTSFEGSTATLYIPTKNQGRETVMQLLVDQKIISSPMVFDQMASRAGYWDKVRPGKYVIEKGTSAFRILRTLRNGNQSPVNLVLNKFRTREDIARYLDRQLEADSSEFLGFFNDPDSTRVFGLDTNNIITAIVPNTYTVYWNTPAYKILRRLYSEREEFWNDKRVAALRNTGLSKEQAYILASIVEEETNKNDEKPLIASVYLNRMKRNMTLSADPTVKFALRDFGLKRITLNHIRESAGSPYNTYMHKGLPPGPICTPSVRSIDAVLAHEQTDYLFFCAKPDFSGYHSFASNEEDHFRNARAYQKALDSLLIK